MTPDPIQNLIDEQAARISALLEEFCERSLTDSEGRGVLISRIDKPDVAGYEYRIELSHAVPWGTMMQVES